MAPSDEPPLRVAVDAQPLLLERTGVGQFTASVLAGLGARDDVDASGYVISRTGRRALEPILPSGVRAATSVFPARVAHALWARGAWPPLEQWTGPVDVVHATNYVALPSRAPVVVSVYDLGFVHSPELYRPETRAYEPLVRDAIARRAFVHTISDFVTAEVREHFGVAADRVARVYPGVTDTRLGAPAAGHTLAGGASYVLALGTVEPRKDLPTLVHAFDRLAATDAGVLLVVAGPDGWGVGQYEDAVAHARFGARVRRLGYVSDAQRADLLAGATVLAYPSRYEGFGLPPLEAMAAGVPVVTTRGGALPEAVGDAALLVDPGDTDGLADALARAVGDEGLRRTLASRGRARAATFPWSRTVGDLVDLYRRVASSGEHRAR
ncbi:MAG TPA: glycosyltransferase family 1 protein [Acidimicrobiia bacterium]